MQSCAILSSVACCTVSNALLKSTGMHDYHRWVVNQEAGDNLKHGDQCVRRNAKWSLKSS